MIIGWAGDLTAEVDREDYGFSKYPHARVQRWTNGIRVETVFDRPYRNGPMKTQRAVRMAKKMLRRLAAVDCTEAHAFYRDAQGELREMVL